MRILPLLPILLVAAPLAAAAQDDLATRGEYVARAADCTACHTATGGAPFAGGYAVESPMGTIWSTNITPSADGIGGWTEAQFAKAVRKGVTPSGKHLYPAMPYDAYAGITDDDMAALYAYFTQKVEPAETPADAQITKLDFPFDQRWLMAGWNLMFAGGTPFEAQSGEAPEIARGRYLTDVLGHCSSCHTPRNVFMANEGSSYLAGADLRGWVAPNLTSDPVTGIGDWSEDEIAGFLQTGQAAGKGIAAGSMAEAVEHSLQYLTDEDAHAIAAYLKQVPAKQNAVGPVPDKAAFVFGSTGREPYGSISGAAAQTLADADAARPAFKADDATRSDFKDETNGALLYDAACSSCHGLGGQGSEDGYYPSLMGSSAVGATTPNNLVMTVMDGVSRKWDDKSTYMPGFARDMTDAQVSAVVTYVADSFGNPQAAASPETVATLRAGGPAPLLARLGAWVFWGPVIVVVLLLLAGIGVARRRKRRG